MLGDTTTLTATITASNSVGEITTATTITITGLPQLNIVKSGPTAALAGYPITYTLVVSNSGVAAATNVVITDVIPVGASYIAGGTKAGNVVSWTISTLDVGEIVTKTFRVTATDIITNSDYRLTATGGYSATDQHTVTTVIRNWRLLTSDVTVPVSTEHNNRSPPYVIPACIKRESTDHTHRFPLQTCGNDMI